MTSDKRARQKENRANRIAAAEAAASRARLRSRLLTYGSLAIVIVVAIIAVAVLVGDDDPETTDPGSATDDPVVTTTVAGWDDDSATACPPAEGSAERVVAFDGPPPLCIDPDATYTATVATTAGEFVIELDAAAAPATVNNFVVLSRYRYYDGVPFHRVIEGFVIQGGDPVGDPPGTGGPGYRFADELPEAGAYEVGSVAMANSGPDTNGSQFFVVTGPDGADLPPLYSLFGTVTEGLDVVTEIGRVETDADDQPVDDVVIDSVTITES